jgi:hypothetical protein
MPNKKPDTSGTWIGVSMANDQDEGTTACTGTYQSVMEWAERETLATNYDTLVAKLHFKVEAKRTVETIITSVE